MHTQSHRFSPVHEQLTEPAARDVVDYGGVLLAGAIDPRDLLRVKTGKDIDSLEELYETIPSLERAVGAFVAAQEIEDVSARCVRQYPRHHGLSHTDNDVREGVSLIIPVSGTGDLYINEQLFDVARTGRAEPDAMSWRYGPGDIAVIRQNLISVNDKRLQRPKTKMHHIGLSTTPRWVMAAHLTMPNVWTKFTHR